MKILLAVLGTALVAVGGAAIHFAREIDAQRRQVADLQAQLQQRDERIASMSAAPVTPPMFAATVQESQAATPAAGPGPSAANTQAELATAAQEFMARAQALSASPEAVARMRMTSRAMLEQSNPDIGEALGLTAEEQRKLFDLMATHQERMTSLVRVTPDANSPATAEERGAAMRATQQENEAELQAMLGSKYSLLKDYNESRQAWQQRRDLRVVLEASGTPLTDAQSKALIAALSPEHRGINQELQQELLEAANQGRPLSGLRRRHTPERRQQLLSAAAPHLSPQQLEGFRGMLERAAEQEQAALSLLQAAEARAAAPSAGASAPP